MNNRLKIIGSKEGVIVEVFVKPNSPVFKIKIVGDEIVVCSTEEPIKGRVNKEIVKELTRFFGRRIQIVSGVTSRHKRILIECATEIEVQTLFSQL